MSLARGILEIQVTVSLVAVVMETVDTLHTLLATLVVDEDMVVMVPQVYQARSSYLPVVPHMVLPLPLHIWAQAEEVLMHHILEVMVEERLESMYLEP